MKQAVAYLFVMWLCSFLIDLFALRQQPKNDFTVREPKRETGFLFVYFFLGLIFLFVRFSGIVEWEHLKPLFKLATLPLILCVFPVALAITLFIKKYKPKDLGLRFQGFIVVIPVIVICAITNMLVCPKQLTWDAVMEESGGLVGALFTGFIVSGLSEEFFKAIGQTRIGALLKNKALGWFIITTMWALMHFPKWYGEEHDFAEAIIGSIRIIPIGLMWGYMTHRTKSFLPATIVHGMNYWGLQNF